MSGVLSVAAVGDNCIDRYVGSDGRDEVGGNALNVAVGVRHAGLPALYLGAVGEDENGRRIAMRLRAAGVDVSHIAQAKGASGVTVVRVEDGERRFESEDYGVAAHYRIDAAALRVLHGCSWVHGARLADGGRRDAGGAWPVDEERLECTATAFAVLAGAGMAISYDFTDEWQAAVVERLCPSLEVAFFSGAGLIGSRARDTAREAVARGARQAVVTRGALGALALAGDVWIERAAEPVAVVDSLGAGDALIAGFIAARVGRAATEVALERGMATAAETCAHLGAWRLDGREAEVRDG